MQSVDKSLALSKPLPPDTDIIQRIAVVIGGMGFLIMLIAAFGVRTFYTGTWLAISLILISSGILLYGWRAYHNKPAGIKNNGVWFDSLVARGALGWMFGIVLTGFYVLLYWYPSVLGLSEAGNTGMVAFFDPLSIALKGQPASQWFVYGVLYTMAILLFGVRFILKYRYNRYQVIRTISVMFFQLGFAFLIPEILLSLNLPYNDFKNIWPLNYYFFDEWNVRAMIEAGTFGMFMLVWGILLILLISPVLTYFYGKRWYCSWVCGCGGLAETAGDPFRHLSDNSLLAWRVERVLIHSVLVFSVIFTIAVIYNYLHAQQEYFALGKVAFTGIVLLILVIGAALLIFRPNLFPGLSKRVRTLILLTAGVISAFLLITVITGGSQVFMIESYKLRQAYGFLIGAAFSGVIGVGFYPIMGSRVWCRFGCPMAAILGVQQRFLSRFRITTNGGQCISCGNCSTYCEMGIDVRAYAQKGQNIVRASCVGCGICAAVCPRGVLRLENGAVDLFERTTALRTKHVQADRLEGESMERS